ncbi:uncharacterized protein PFLUO_LOCUS4014 [Penicillium psychrofluorescens]|uniref:uncharacterized protein n=1 Tax=Penicillium psychrofluorescens TaxID=3158075 RepID=UPI003CCD3F31
MTACTAHQKGKQVVGGVGIAEVLAYNDRAKGLAFMNLMLNTANVLNTYVPPIGIQNCSWRFYFMYIAWDAFGVVVIYFTFVETKGWNLEEIDELFHSKSPVKKSLEKRE